MLLHIFLTTLAEAYPATNVRKTFVTTIFWQNFKLSHSIVVGVGAETMLNQITIMFSKEQHENIPSMHLNKICKSEKWKKQRIEVC